MILIDANLRIYAVDADAPHHARAKRWLEGATLCSTDNDFKRFPGLAHVKPLAER